MLHKVPEMEKTQGRVKINFINTYNIYMLTQEENKPEKTNLLTHL
jgi:hypothetical protein